MKSGCASIPWLGCVEARLRTNPSTERAEPIERVERIESVTRAYCAGARCQCRSPIRIIGSAQNGSSYLTCSWRQTASHPDREIHVTKNASSTGRPGRSSPRRAQHTLRRVRPAGLRRAGL
jgi:hypothetical protein